MDEIPDDVMKVAVDVALDLGYSDRSSVVLPIARAILAERKAERERCASASWPHRIIFGMPMKDDPNEIRARVEASIRGRKTGDESMNEMASAPLDREIEVYNELAGWYRTKYEDGEWPLRGPQGDFWAGGVWYFVPIMWRDR